MHRVLVPDDVNLRRKCRQSVPFFATADNGVIIRPLDGSDKHPPIEALTYLRGCLARRYQPPNA